MAAAKQEIHDALLTGAESLDGFDGLAEKIERDIRSIRAMGLEDRCTRVVVSLMEGHAALLREQVRSARADLDVERQALELEFPS